MMRIQFFLLLLLQVATMAAANAPPAFLQVPRGGGWLWGDEDSIFKKSDGDKVLKDVGSKWTDAKDDVKGAVANAKKDAESIWSKKLDSATKKYDDVKQQMADQKEDAAKRLDAERKKLNDKAGIQESALKKQIDALKKQVKDLSK
eukprot:CAMPEP_0119011654 /NCGR_PEP_ID=MMETSP1176-20130426/5805_1 /TAXON_ID=265551 /ORGANISM="Synedropsis recta cf, Strain CCMP1620" /LENGTH=145 /DNA_ID=CAMNT_0006964511 /DNA_START=226 /DNA_END=663 /DNA_ORIENTATION=+